jgi:rSAM/selenodomain-associated transferase 1
MPPDAPPITLLCIAKAPIAGRVKTRLCPPFTAEQAAELASAALLDTLDALAATPASRRVLVLDGEVFEGIPADFDVVPQRGNGLAERLTAAFADAAAGRPALVVGMDTPQVTAGLLSRAVERLLSPAVDAVFGLAADGGWWTLGLRQPQPEAFVGVPMSTAQTGAHQLRRLDHLGLAVHSLPTLTDVDTAADAAAVATTCPGTRFGRLHAALTRAHAPCAHGARSPHDPHSGGLPAAAGATA